jgi:hypothetical protein
MASPGAIIVLSGVQVATVGCRIPVIEFGDARDAV